MTISLTAVELKPAGDGVELHGVVEYRGGRAEDYFFRFPGTLSVDLSSGGNPWIVVLLPLAVTLGETLHIGLPVDEVLCDNLRKAMQIWHSWDARLKPVPLEVDTLRSSARKQSRTGQFFTGGIDSFFAVGRFESDRGSKVDDLIFIHGYDIPLGNQRAWRSAADNVQRCSDALQKTCILPASNLRETRWSETRWPELSHGAALIGTGLMLEPRYGRLVLPASWDREESPFWGSHPDVDVLFSTSQTEVVHFGFDWTRAERTQWILQSRLRELALSRLRVCVEDPEGGNCGRCGKCLRTMATLELFDSLGEAKAFPEPSNLLVRLARLYYGQTDRIFIRQVRDLAGGLGRDDVRSAIEMGLRRTAALDRRYRIPQLQSLGLHVKRRYPRIWGAMLPMRVFAKLAIEWITNPARRRSVSSESH
jgi:hypothetical protein